MVGLAVGDALGAPVEFDPPTRIAGRREELFAMPGDPHPNALGHRLMADAMFPVVSASARAASR